MKEAEVKQRIPNAMKETGVKISIVVIFDKLREEKLHRLLSTLQPQLDRRYQNQTGNHKDHKHHKDRAYETELLLIHESDTRLPAPNLGIDLKAVIRYINIPAKQGIAFNRNKGISYSSGKIIVFIDDDCWVHENWLDSLVGPLIRDPRLLAVTSGTKIPKANFVGNCISSLGFPGGGSLGFEKVWKVSTEGFTNHLAVGNCALRRELFNKVGMFDESMECGAEDAELSFRIEKAGVKIKYVPGAHAFHEARTSLSSFVKWQLRRGKANNQFKKKVGGVGGFVKLRFWSAKNILKKNSLNLKFPFIVSFLGASFVLQQAGYLIQEFSSSNERSGDNNSTTLSDNKLAKRK